VPPGTRRSPPGLRLRSPSRRRRSHLELVNRWYPLGRLGYRNARSLSATTRSRNSLSISPIKPKLPSPRPQEEDHNRIIHLPLPRRNHMGTQTNRAVPRSSPPPRSPPRPGGWGGGGAVEGMAPLPTGFRPACPGIRSNCGDHVSKLLSNDDILGHRFCCSSLRWRNGAPREDHQTESRGRSQPDEIERALGSPFSQSQQPPITGKSGLYRWYRFLCFCGGIEIHVRLP